jgi:hypothetical protein
MIFPYTEHVIFLAGKAELVSSMVCLIGMFKVEGAQEFS